MGAIEAIQRIEHKIRSRFDTVADQLKSVQMNFMIDVELGRANQDTNSDTNSDTVQPIDLLSLPRYIDHDFVERRGEHRDDCRMDAGLIEQALINK